MNAQVRIGRSMTRPAAALALGLALSGCDSTAPEYRGAGQFTLVPSLPSALADIEIREAQLFLRRLDGRVAVDSTVPVQPGPIEIELRVEIVVGGGVEDFDLSLVLLDEDGRELYRSADDPQRITIAATGQITPISVPMRYTGPGAEAQTLEISGSDVPLTPAAPVTLQAQPRDGSGNLLGDAPIGWRTRNPGDADVVELDIERDRTVRVGLAGDPPFPGSIDIVAELPRVLEGVDPVAAIASLAVEELFGRYDLITVNGEPLPVFLPDESQILSGVAQLNTDLTWAAEIVYDFSGSDTSGGTFSVSGSQITFVDVAGPPTTGVLSDGHITVPDPETADEYVFRRTQELVGLIVTGTGAGAGAVTSAPSGIDCTIDAGQTSGTCQEDFGRGQIVRLEAVPDSRSLFSFWSLHCGKSPICDVTLGQSQTVTVQAAFGLETQFPPVLSNMRYELVELNAEQFCAIQQPPGSWFRVFVDYTDVNGDVTPGLVVLRDSSSAFATVTVTLPGTDPATNLNYTLSGSGFEGSITLTNLCLRFGNLNSVTKYWTVWDAAGLESNMYTVTILRPAGANTRTPAARPTAKGGRTSSGS